jgi:lysophospholipase L1-like esterase
MSYESSAATKNASVGAVAALCNSGFIRVYSGTRPATPDSALSSNTLLATFVFGATAFGAASSGIATANAIASVTAVASGIASFARVFQSDGTTVIGDLNCGTSVNDITFPTLSFVSGATISCTSLALFISANTLVFDGNSFLVFAGSLLVPYICDVLESFGQYFNNGVGGEQTTTMTANAPTVTDPLFRRYQGPGNVVVAVEITNDIAIGGASATTAYNDIVAYCAARRSVGWKVIITSCLSRTVSGLPNFNTIRDAVNANIASNWPTFADGYANWASDPIMGIDGAENNTTYFSGDGVHPNNVGYARLAPYVAAAIQSLGYK